MSELEKKIMKMWSIFKAANEINNLTISQLTPFYI